MSIPDLSENIVEGPFRMTRNLVPFSPWFTRVGVPLHAPADFFLHRTIQAAISQQERTFASWEDERSPPRTPDQDELPVSTPDDYIPVSTTSAPDFIPVPDIPTPPAPSPVPSTPFDDTLTKGQYHRKKQKKKRRARKRMAGQDLEMNRPVKGIALDAAANALVVEPSIELSQGLPRDNGQTNALPGTSSERLADSRPRGPIISDLRLDMDALPVASSAFVGVLREPTPEELACTELDDFKRMDFQYVQWDGIETLVILDHTGTYVVCTFGPAPNDSSYRVGVNEALKIAFADAHARYHFPEEPNRRGEDVKAVPVGISMGGGQSRPGNITHTTRVNSEVAEDLRTNHATFRVANHGNALLQVFQPELYKLYDRTLTDLCERDPTLRRNFTNNVFACATFNVGPHTMTRKHVDFLNLPYGMCAITALGNYDPTR